MVFWLVCAVISLSVLFGGGTHAGYLGDVAIQLSAIPLLITAILPAWRRKAELSEQDGSRKAAWIAIAICCMTAAVICLQLIPLPFEYWSKAGDFSPLGENLTLSDLSINSQTVSLSPQATWAAAASCIGPLAVFAGVLQLSTPRRLAVCQLLLGLGAVSLVLGFLQVAQGPESILRFYAFTNPSEAVGFFANRNHFAALLNVTLVLAALWFAQTAAAPSRHHASSSFLAMVIAAVCVVAVVAGLAVARSRAGFVIAVLVLMGIVMMMPRQGRQKPGTFLSWKSMGGSRSMVVLVVFALGFTAQVGLVRLATRFQGDLADDLRIRYTQTTFATALKALPFGTGLGSFVPVYATVENQADVAPAFANRAHNDFVEFFLETGIVGAALILLFGIWYLRGFYRAWWKQILDKSQSRAQTSLQRASSLIVGLVLAHSLVDYPLRTAALSSIFAMFCAILTRPAPKPETDAAEQAGTEPGRSVSARKQSGPRRPWEQWQDGDAWPAPWQKG